MNFSFFMTSCENQELLCNFKTRTKVAVYPGLPKSGFKQLGPDFKILMTNYINNVFLTKT